MSGLGVQAPRHVCSCLLSLSAIESQLEPSLSGWTESHHQVPESSWLGGIWRYICNPAAGSFLHPSGIRVMVAPISGRSSCLPASPAHADGPKPAYKPVSAQSLLHCNRVGWCCSCDASRGSVLTPASIATATEEEESMDAFVVRTPQLFASDAARLLLRDDASGDADAAATVRRDLEAGGGRIVDQPTGAADVDDAEVTLVVVVTPEPQLTPELHDEIAACRRRHPLATVVPAHWVLSCVRQRKRLQAPTNLGESTVAAKKADDDANDKGPDRKKRRVESAAESAAPEGKGPREDSGSSSTGDGGVPDVTRSWKTVADGALHFWDARAASDVDVQNGLQHQSGQQHQTQTQATGDAGSSRPRVKLAAFDLDGTLITTKSGKRFAQNADDWTLFHATRVATTLRRLATEGFTLVIVSNQNGVAKGKTSAREVQTKMQAVVRRLNVPMLVLFATQDDEMRKPRTGAWRWLLQELRLKPEDVDMAASFYCGDAAGRPKIAGRNKDFAATDYKFALNLGLGFRTPEELFLQTTQRIHTRPEMWEIDFDPRAIPTDDSTDARKRLDPPTAEYARQGVVELVVLTGPPASGKSHVASHFTGYEVVCQDDLKTVARCVAACTRALEAGKSVVVDSTNRDARGRKDWLALAKKHGVAARCFFMDVAKPLSMHLNTFRKLTSSKEIPDIAIHTFFKNYVAPTKEEGFEAVVKVRFCVETASLSDAHRRLIMSFL